MRAMKDSGVEWIGKIPDEWKVCKLKKLITFINGYPFDSSVMGDEGNCSVVRIGDLQNNGVAYDTALKVEYHDGLSKYLIRNDDILIAMSGATVGKFAIVNNITESACVNQRVGIIRSNISGYLKYVLASSGFSSYITLLSEGTAQPNISTTNINNFSICIPPPAETQIIIAYLDTKCAEIDKVVEKTRATIEEYKKLKKAIITDAVTKGVRGPRPMKPSGVEWIGDIPEEWRVTKIRKVCANQISDGTHATPEYATQDDGFPFLSSKDVRKGYIDWSGIKYITQKTHEQIKRNITPQVGDVLLSKNGSIGFSAVVEDEREFDIYVTLALLRPNSLILTKYLKYTLDCESTQKQFSLHLIGIGVPNLHLHVIQNTKILIPPIEEQQEIATYLDTKCAEIDRIIEKKEQLIEELGSYKKSLIYEYVTGKKEIKIHNYSQNAIC